PLGLRAGPSVHVQASERRQAASESASATQDDPLSHSTVAVARFPRLARKLERPHPVVLRIGFALGEMESLEDRRDVHAEATSESLLESVPTADRIPGRPSPRLDVP